MREPAPAFQCYPDTLLSDPNVAVLDPLETGVFFRLYLHAWLDRDGLSSDARDLAALARCSLPAFKKAWARIGRCFELRDGRYFFAAHEIERQSQAEFRAKRSAAGRSGAGRRWTGPDSAEPLPFEKNGIAIPDGMAKNGKAIPHDAKNASKKMATEHSPSPSPSPSPEGRDTNVSLPPAVEDEFGRFVELVAAANTTGKISVGRVASLRRELEFRVTALGPDAMLYGLREAVIRGKPVLGYAVAAAKGYRPEPDRFVPPARAVRAGSLDDRPVALTAEERL